MTYSVATGIGLTLLLSILSTGASLGQENITERAIDVALSRDGRWLATQGTRGTNVWDLAERQKIFSTAEPMIGVTLSDDGRSVALFGGRSYRGTPVLGPDAVQVFETATGKRFASIEVPFGGVDARGTVLVMERMLSMGGFNEGHSGFPGAPFAFDSTGKRLAAGGCPSAMSLSVRCLFAVVALPEPTDTTRAPDKSLKVLRSIAVGYTPDWRRQGRGSVLMNPFNPRVVLSSDAQRMVIGGMSDGAVILDQIGKLLSRLSDHSAEVTKMAFGGEFLATGSRNGRVVLRDLAKGEKVATLKGHKGAITAVTFSADARLLAASSDDGALSVWEVGSGTRLRAWTTTPPAVALHFTPAGDVIEWVGVHRDDVHRFELHALNIVTGAEVPWGGKPVAAQSAVDEGRR